MKETKNMEYNSYLWSRDINLCYSRATYGLTCFSPNAKNFVRTTANLIDQRQYEPEWGERKKGYANFHYRRGKVVNMQYLVIDAKR